MPTFSSEHHRLLNKLTHVQSIRVVALVLVLYVLFSFLYLTKWWTYGGILALLLYFMWDYLQVQTIVQLVDAQEENTVMETDI